MAWRWMIASNKGGPGKTSTAAGLAGAAARRGLRVLCVDMDPQGNLTRRLGADHDYLTASASAGIAACLDPDTPALPTAAVCPAGWPHPYRDQIHLLPSIAVEPLERRAKEAGEAGAAGRLRHTLDGFDEPYHLTIIDTGPGLNHLFDMALVAADRVLIVLEPAFDAVAGGGRVAAYVDKKRDRLGRPDLRVGGVLLNRLEGEAATHRAYAAKLPEMWGGLLWHPFIPYRLTLANADNDGVSIDTIRTVQAAELGAMFDQHLSRMLAVQQAAAR